MGRWIGGWLLLTWALVAQAANPQVVQLGDYDFALYANADLAAPTLPVRHAVILIYGVRRNAADYFASGSQLLGNAGLNANDSLLIAPHFLTDTDTDEPSGIPRWAAGQWLHGSPSYSGVPAFKVLDDLLALLANRQRFPALKDVLLVGHSAGGQLVQRYAIFNNSEPRLSKQGIALRYGVASPSSYLYFDNQRWQHGKLTTATPPTCPGFNRYRYGLDNLPAYAAEQRLTAKQWFRRYAQRQVIYLVGSDDNNPEARVMDRSCPAQLQGPTRRQRQEHYLAYEQQLAKRWGGPLHHRNAMIDGIGHRPSELLAAPATAKALFP